MKKTAWSHLPNAMHIDRVLASVKAHPDVWSAVDHAAGSAAWADDRDAAWNAAGAGAVSAEEDEDRITARNAAWNAAVSAAGDAIAALVAWDDCSQYLDMPGDQLEVWYHLSEQPACLLLLPAVRAFEQIEELELA
jgi:hypothetical protein